jgi:hypothetical protein
VVLYIDDILIYSATFEDHISHVQEVLEHLLENHLYVKAARRVSSISPLSPSWDTGSARRERLWMKGRLRQSAHGQSQPP